MFWQRDVLRFEGDEPRHRRVVWSDQRHVWLFDLDASKTSFERWDRGELEGMLRARSVLVAGKEAYDAFHLDSALTDNQRRYRDEITEVVAPLVVRVPEIFDERVRGAAVADHVAGRACARLVGLRDVRRQGRVQETRGSAQG